MSYEFIVDSQNLKKTYVTNLLCGANVRKV
jgi:hypothetical protein